MRPHLLFAVAASLKLCLVLAAPAAAAPTLDSALPCGTAGSAGGLGAGTGIWRIDVDTTRYPEALCNDGTGAVFYVRQAADPADRDRWHIHLQGGGGCRDAESCAKRWCSVDTNFGMDKMTSALAPTPGARARGMLSQNAANPLRDWNQVLVYYCSSDSWSGTRSAIDLTAEAPGGAGSVDYEIQFQGANILDAVLDTLRRENGIVQYTDETATRTMPDLDEAELVILAGASAGGNGVVRQADRVGDKLAATNVSCGAAGGCDLDYRAVFDAAYIPDQSVYSYAQTPFCSEYGLCTYAAHGAEDWANAQLGLWQAQTDDSCLAWHATHMPGYEWRCGDSVYIVENHLLTPHFIRFDLQDPLVNGNMHGFGFTWLGLPISEKVFGLLSYLQLSRVEDLWQTAAEGHQGRGEPATRPAVFGAQCAHHASLLNTGMYLEARAPDADGISRRMPELLVNWLNGTGPQTAIVPFTTTGALPHCP